jgi:hypothetical protein
VDYVDWCDSLSAAMADYAEQHDLNVHLHQFSGDFIASRPTLTSPMVGQAVVLDSAEILGVLGFDRHSPLVRFRHSDLPRLRDSFTRWLHAFTYELYNVSLALLNALNRLSQREENGYTTVEEVDLDRIVEELSQGTAGITISSEQAEELLDDLEHMNLAHSDKTIATAEYKSSYLGVARTARARVTQDQEIDALRTAGEGDTLDFKRTGKLNSPTEKQEFAKDVTALANAGGAGSRFLLLGIEDDGTFFVPPSPEEDAQHRQSLARIQETQLQEIVTSRTTQSPSVRIAARGEHRDGPYVLIEITRDVSHLPYRVFRDQPTRTGPDAHALGEVWVRKGSTKARATDAEIAALERQAALYTHIRAGSPGDGS